MQPSELCIHFVIIVMLQVTELWEQCALFVFAKKIFCCSPEKYTSVPPDRLALCVIENYLFYGRDVTSRLVSWSRLSWIFLLCDDINKSNLHRPAMVRYIQAY